MRDDHLLQDLEPLPYAQDTLFALKDHAITTYTQLFALIKDPNANTDLRAKASWILSAVYNIVDKRSAVPPLLIALESPDEDIRSSAAHALGMLRSRRAIIPLMNLLQDESQSHSVRHEAIDALASIEDEHTLPLFWEIINNPDENVLIRGRAIEMLFETPDPIQKIIKLLSDPISDIRFWAAYRLATAYADISPGLKALDQIVAFDHSVPTYGLWHVDREAILPLETIYYRHALGVSAHTDEDNRPRFNMYLVSPAPEYMTFDWHFLERQDDWSYQAKPLPPVTLTISSDWLENQLRQSWPDIKLNTRQPRPQAYLLDWKWFAEEKILIGALHRDKYSIVLTGDFDRIGEFTAWYRGLFPITQKLFCYEWGHLYTELQPGMTAHEIMEAITTRANSSQRKIDELAKGFPG